LYVVSFYETLRSSQMGWLKIHDLVGWLIEGRAGQHL